jgi:hypothetical protein
MKLIGRLVRVEELTPGQREQMFALMDAHYCNMVRARFEQDLAEKQWAIVVRDPITDELRGFSTQVLLGARVQGRPVKVLFSGDTIVDRHHWGDNALSQVWGRFALSLMDAHAGDELYWFLISKGYKTYRFLPLFFHEFYPRPEAPTPAWASNIIDALARQKFPHDYDELAGVIRADGSKDRLRDGVAPVTDERRRDPYIDFFVRKNPGHERGEELCCLAPLTRENFTRAAYRVIGESRLVAAT